MQNLKIFQTLVLPVHTVWRRVIIQGYHLLVLGGEGNVYAICFQQSCGHIKCDSRWLPWQQCLGLTHGQYLLSFGFDFSENVTVAHYSFHKLQHPQACFAHSFHFFNCGIESLQET